MQVVDRIDITRQPVSDLVERMHRHAVSRVIFGAGHTQLNKVEEAVGACEIDSVAGADFIQTSIAKPAFDAFDGRPMEIPFMTTDAEMCQAELKSFNQMSGPVF